MYQIFFVSNCSMFVLKYIWLNLQIYLSNLQISVSRMIQSSYITATFQLQFSWIPYVFSYISVAFQTHFSCPTRKGRCSAPDYPPFLYLFSLSGVSMKSIVFCARCYLHLRWNYFNNPICTKKRQQSLSKSRKVWSAQCFQLFFFTYIQYSFTYKKRE